VDEDAGSGRELVAQVVNDFSVESALRAEPNPLADPSHTSSFVKLVQTALSNPTSELWVEDPDNPLLAAALQAVTEAVRRVRERERTSLSFDGLLREAYRLVTAEEGALLRAQLQDRYRLAVVDEAQDTDPLQWGLLEHLFPLEGERIDPRSTPLPSGLPRSLFVVGDPKQSIYAFRGADVEGYVQSRGRGATLLTLDRNFRSDPSLLRALNLLFAGAEFGAGVRYLPVQAPDSRTDRPLPEGEPAVDLILLEGDGSQEHGGEPTRPISPAGCAAREVERALRSGRFLPKEIAVLVGTNVEAGGVHEALAELGIPSVTAGAGSVLDSDAADHLRIFLRALERPRDTQRVRLMSIGWFGSLHAGDLIRGGDDVLLSTEERLVRLQRVLLNAGTAALLREILEAEGTLDRMAERGDLARNLTDLSHLGELLFHDTQGRGTSATAVLAAFQGLQRVESQNELVLRRIATDEERVQIRTIHSAKGLQFELVVVAKKWRKASKGGNSSSVPLGRFGPPDPAAGGEIPRRIDCGWGVKKESPGASAARIRAEEEEDDRLFYVAATRAKHQLILIFDLTRSKGEEIVSGGAPFRCFGIAPGEAGDASSLEQLLNERARSEGISVEGTPGQGGSGTPLWRVRSGLLPEGQDGRRKDRVGTGGDGRRGDAGPTQPFPPEAYLVASPLPHALIAPKRRWSFSGVTAGAKGALSPSAIELEPRGGTDEFAFDSEDLLPRGPSAEGGALPLGGSPGTLPLFLRDLPAGADFGTMVHSVLEHSDFHAADLEAELRSRVDRFANSPTFRPRSEDLVRGLAGALRTPLGTGEALDFSLSTLPFPQRLDELHFDLSLADGSKTLSAREVGRWLKEQLPSEDPLQDYAAALERGPLTAPLQGMLNGLIDLVVHRPGASPGGTPGRFLIVDYKTNRLDHYRQDALLDSMIQHHYPLQGLFYSAALFRFLRWRLGVPDPSAHLDGFAYLFIRGMGGPETPIDDQGRRDGVFHWRAPEGFLRAFSDLLSGGSP